MTIILLFLLMNIKLDMLIQKQMLLNYVAYVKVNYIIERIPNHFNVMKPVIFPDFIFFIKKRSKCNFKAFLKLSSNKIQI